MKKKWLALFMAVILTMGMTACGSKAEKPSAGNSSKSVETAETAEEEQAQKEENSGDESSGKDELVVAVGDMTEGDYDACQGYTMYGTNIFYSSLLKINKDIEAEPDLATDYKVSDDGLTYTFTLRDDVKFSDGEPVTAKDVVFTFETAKETGASVDLTMMDKVEAPDDTTVVFMLNKPFSPFTRTVALQGIAAEHAYGDDYAAAPVASGPFKVKQLDVGQQLIVEPNEYYYGDQSPFSQITFLNIDEETALSYAQAGTLDVVKINPEYAKEEVENMHLETYETSDNRGFSLPCIAETTNSSGAKVGNNATADPAVRKALNIGISRQEIIDNALNGIGTPAWVRFENIPWANEEPGLEDGQTEEACGILEEAGWVDEDGDGIREKDGQKCELSITGRTDDLQRYNLAEAFAENAKKLGIHITAEAEEWTTCKEQGRSIPTCIGTGDYSFIDVYNAFASEYADPDATDLNNAAMYTNKKVDEYLQQAMEARSEEEAVEYLKKAQYDGETGPNVDFPYIWLVNIDHTYFVRDGLDIGEQMVHPHGHGLPIIQNLNEWVFEAGE